MGNKEHSFSAKVTTDGECLDLNKEQIFQEIRPIVYFYLKTDFNAIKPDEIDHDIRCLISIYKIPTHDKTAQNIQEQIRKINDLFYKVRKQIVTGVDRPDRYYTLMVCSLQHFKKIKIFLDPEFPFSTETITDGEFLNLNKKQIFQEIRSVVDFYLTVDLDEISAATIDCDIKRLRSIYNIIISDNMVNTIQEKIILEIIDLFYKAHKRVITRAHRPDDYYTLMSNSLRLFKDIQDFFDQE